MTTFVTGSLALGTSTDPTVFVEQTGTGYEQQAITLNHVSNNRSSNVEDVTFEATDTDWGTVTQYAVTVDGIVQFHWYRNPINVPNGGTLNIASNTISLLFEPSVYHGYSEWVSGDVIGQDAASNPIFVDSRIFVRNGASITPQAATGIPITSADSVTTLHSMDGDTELDLRSSGSVWVFSDDGEDTGTAGLGSGNATDSSGAVAIYTGDAANDSGLVGISTGVSTGGTTGNIGLKTGDATAGNSGDIALTIGTAGATRGKIILDAPSVHHESDVTCIFGPDPASEGVYGIVADGLNIMATNENGDNIGAWLYSQDADNHTAGTGIGTGNLLSGAEGTQSGDVWVYSGNVQSGAGRSGTAFLETGDVVDGPSGDINIVTGHSTGSGVRGNILLDANQINGAPNQFFELCSLGTGGVDLFTNGVTGSDTSGGVGVGTGSTETGASGDVQLYTGNSSGGNSGNISIGTGGADGSRGVIVLDAPQITAPSGFNMTAINGGVIALTAGDCSADNGDGGGVTILSGHGGPSSGASGNVYIASPENDTGNTGGVGMESGGTTTGTSGGAFLGTSDAVQSGDVAIYGGTSHGDGNQGGNINLYGGGSSGASAAGGDITINPGGGTSRNGLVILNSIPTADPHVVGAVWNSSGTLMISAGP